MEKVSESRHIVAFIGKDEKWHFIDDEKTWEIGYEDGVVILNDEVIPVDDDTQAQLIETLSKRNEEND